MENKKIRNLYKNVTEEILYNKEVERIPIKSIEVITKLLEDQETNKILFKGFMDNLDLDETLYDIFTAKVQDMIYRLDLLVSDCLQDIYEIDDFDSIKNIFIKLSKNNNVSFFDAVSYDKYDNEIIDEFKEEINELLPKKRI